MSSTSDGGKRAMKCVMAVAVCLATAVALTVLPGRWPGTADAQDIGQQRGFALPTFLVTGYDGPDVEQSLREIKALGANWVQFNPAWYQDGRTSSRILRTSKSVSDAGQERAIQLAHQMGLKVLLKPALNLEGVGSNHIAPADHETWFGAYTEFITHYAAMAQRLGVEQFAIATELSSITHNREGWLRVIQAVRDRYDGPLTYAAGPDWERVPFWDALDLIGIDAYAPLSPTPTADVAALRRAAETYLDRLAAMAATHDRKILFTEAGFTSQQGTATDPSSWRISDVPSQAEQAAAYEAVLATFSDQPWWAGIYWWVWITPPFTEPEPLDFSPKDKAAEEVIRRWWVA